MTRKILIRVAKYIANDFAEDCEMDVVDGMNRCCDILNGIDKYNITERIMIDLFMDFVLLIPMIWIATAITVAWLIWEIYDWIDWQVWSIADLFDRKLK